MGDGAGRPRLVGGFGGTKRSDPEEEEAAPGQGGLSGTSSFPAPVAWPRVYRAEKGNLSSVFCSYLVGKTVYKLFKQAEDN